MGPTTVYNQDMEIPVKRFDNGLPLPSSEHRAAGIDLVCREDVEIPPHQIKLVPLNIAVAIPENYFLLVTVRSSTPIRKGLIFANSIGIVDPFFCGDKDEVVAELLNFTDKPVSVKKGELLTQALLIKNETIEWKEVPVLGNNGRGGYTVSS